MGEISIHSMERYAKFYGNYSTLKGFEIHYAASWYVLSKEFRNFSSNINSCLDAFMKIFFDITLFGFICVERFLCNALGCIHYIYI